MSQPKHHGLLAAALLILLTLLFFWKILLTNLILSGVDVFLYFYPYKAYMAQALRQGRLPLWNPHLFMGAPLLANSQVGLFYPLNWPLIWLDAPRQVAWSIGLHIALAAIFMLTFARHSLGLRWLSALVAAGLFAFGGYLGAQVEHVNQLQAAAWLPLLFLLYDFCLRDRQRAVWLLLLSLVIALMLLAGHAQTVFISLFGLGLYSLWRALFEGVGGSNAPMGRPAQIRSLLAPRYWRPVIRSLGAHLWPLAAASGLAVALAAVQLIPTAELSGYSIRRGGLTLNEVVSFSLRPTTLHFSLLPPIDVDLTQIMGQAFSEWVVYVGLSGLLLALLGALTALWHAPARRFLVVAGLGLLLSFGLYTGPLYLALYLLVPGFDLFRVPARWLLLYAFGMAALAGLGFEALRPPPQLTTRLRAVGRWLQAHPLRWLIPALPLLFLLALIVWRRPPITTLLVWLMLTLLAGTLIYFLLRTAHANLHRAALVALALLLTLELFWSAQILNYNRPTAPQAYHSMRNAVAFLLAAGPPDRDQPPDRFLSLSGITYDPGDLPDLRQIFGDRLSETALYHLVVATKEKEVLFFNLPLIYGLHSVDGYDGGILPLARFITLQKLFLPADDLSLDGRLREKLRFVPDNRLLSLLNTRWIITDKQFDVWIDGIFYDLQFPARLPPGQSITTSEVPDFSATAVGLVSHLEGAAELTGGTPVADVTLTLTGGATEQFTLRAGIDTAEGLYPAGGSVAHPQATVGVAWPYAAGGVDYIRVYPVSGPQTVREISVRALLPAGRFVLRGLSLIHQPTTTGRSVLLSTGGDYRQVHSGDVKIYENRDVLPRTFVVHQLEVVPTEAQAIARLKDPQFDLRRRVVQVAEGQPRVEQRGQPSPQDSARIVAYAPERVEIEVQLASPGWLVLTDSIYPGWQATVDGRPAELLPANILFRAVPVPAGSHTVLFEFKPASFWWGAIISGVALALTGAGLVVAGRRRRQL